MNLSLDCIPCFARHALEAARFASSDPVVHERVLREVLSQAARWDLTRPAPLLSQFVQRRLRILTGVADPYQDAKRRFNALALELLPACREMVRATRDPLQGAARFAIAGNIIDFGANGGLREADVREAFSNVIAEPLVGDFEEFREQAAAAQRILYLADNAGEIVFDRLLVEQLPVGRVTVAVRGGPVLNDATLADARLAGLDQVAELTDNGADVPGTVLEQCSEAFRERFSNASMIIAKGQGNFETLAGTPSNIFFLLKIKCPVVASHTGLEVGTLALTRGRVH